MAVIERFLYSDYTHGPMNMIVYVVPNLQDDPQASVACNSLLNTGAWAGDEEFIHTYVMRTFNSNSAARANSPVLLSYTLLLPEEIPKYLACRVLDSRVVRDTLVLGSQRLPRPLDELASRPELITWLTRTLFNTFIPGHSKLRPSNVRLPHNLVAFFGIVMYLHQVGYPGHWLSDFLARVLSGSMVSDVTPYDDFYPIPVSARLQRVKARRVRTDPWLVEFETIIATAYHAIPFPIASALPEDFTRDRADIAVWEVRVEPAQYFSYNPFMNFSSPQDPRTWLLFYRPDVATATVLIDSVQRVFEGRTQPTPGTFFILTAQEYVHYETRVRFKLSKKRVERMRKEKWNMMAYRNDTGQQGERLDYASSSVGMLTGSNICAATRPVPIQQWSLCNEYAS